MRRLVAAALLVAACASTNQARPATVAERPAPQPPQERPPHAHVTFENRIAAASWALASIAADLDGRPILVAASPAALARDGAAVVIFDGPVAPGEHEVALTLVYLDAEAAHFARRRLSFPVAQRFVARPGDDVAVSGACYERTPTQAGRDAAPDFAVELRAKRVRRPSP